MVKTKIINSIIILLIISSILLVFNISSCNNNYSNNESRSDVFSVDENNTHSENFNDNEIETITHNQWKEGYKEKKLSFENIDFNHTGLTASVWDHHRDHFWLKFGNQTDCESSMSYLYKVYMNGTKELVRKTENGPYARVIYVTQNGTILMADRSRPHSNEAVLRSTDGGETFKECFPGSAFQGLTEDKDRGILYLGAYVHSEGHNGIYRSTDDGKTWESIWDPGEWENIYPEHFKENDFTHIHDLFYDDIHDALYAVGGDGDMNADDEYNYTNFGVVRGLGAPNKTNDFDWPSMVGRYTGILRHGEYIYLYDDGCTSPGMVTRFEEDKERIELESFIHKRGLIHAGNNRDPFGFSSGLYDDGSEDGLFIYPTLPGHDQYMYPLLISDGEKFVSIGDQGDIRDINRNRRYAVPAIIVNYRNENTVSIFKDIDFDLLTSPVEINGSDDISLLNSHHRRYYSLTDDLNLKKHNNMSFGFDNGQFDSVLYGNNHSIYNYYLKKDNDFTGLFRHTGANSEIRDLNFFNIYIEGNNHTGTISGYNHGLIENVKITNATIIGENYVGGISGQHGFLTTAFDGIFPFHDDRNAFADLCDSKTLRNVQFKGNVRGNSRVGGLIGECGQFSIVKNCSTEGHIENVGTRSGGIVGRTTRSEIIQSYSKMDIESSSWGTGGIVGTIQDSIIDSAYHIGTIRGTNRVGGIVGNLIRTEIFHTYTSTSIDSCTSQCGSLIGRIDDSSVHSSYYNQLIGKNKGIGEYLETNGHIIEVYGRDEEEMVGEYSSKTYQNWDFKYTWEIDENERINDGYPYFSWEEIEELYEIIIEEPKRGGEIYLDENVISEYPLIKTFKEGTQINLEAKDVENFEFEDWKINDESYNEKNISIIISQDIIVLGRFEDIIEYHELKLNVYGEGSIIIEWEDNVKEVREEWINDFEEGTEITLKTRANEDWVFEKWENEEMDKTTSIIIEEDLKRTAYFKEKEDTSVGILPIVIIILAIILVFSAIYIHYKNYESLL